MPWLTSAQALALLGTKPQTLYANVSRGRIRARPDPADPRRSLYHGEDVRRLAARPAGRRASGAIAAEAIRWGDPVLASAVSTIAGGQLYYRGRDAATLAAAATLEDTAALLWGVPGPLHLGRPVDSVAPGVVPSLSTALAVLAAHIGADAPTIGRSQADLTDEAARVLDIVAATLAPGPADQPLHRRLALVWDRPEAGDALRRALVLLADHELNASTFACRVAVSTGAPLSAAVLSGLATLTGPLHGGAWRAVRAAVAQTAGDEQAVRDYFSEGRAIAGFGHALYPDGDVRAEALFESFEIPAPYAAVRKVGEEIFGDRVNVDFALAALTSAHRLPDDAPLVVFAVARTVGWLAHAVEQAVGGSLIRPRARYVGPPPELPA
ncbi:citrate synthase [Devosia nitrariae]|uniref:citrate synthase (unknown stereospecificity) n=1 Tax=Devosia nitrariae TaxID=2071872 RepID=A0ABQ5W666_9HYPH|nr:citrate synthase [Devosia nitrariae]GLQ55286.1 citrate synthase [Devosia nitrariae]